MTEKKELPEWLEKARLTPKRTRKQRKELFPHGFTDCTDCEEFIRKAQQQADYDAFLKQRLDSSAREKIVGILNCEADQCSDWCEGSDGCLGCQADQILALFDVEEAKREERERIFKEIENKMFSQPIDYDGKFGLDLSTNRYQSYEKWQALKDKE